MHIQRHMHAFTYTHMYLQPPFPHTPCTHYPPPPCPHTHTTLTWPAANKWSSSPGGSRSWCHWAELPAAEHWPPDSDPRCSKTHHRSPVSPPACQHPLVWASACCSAPGTHHGKRLTLKVFSQGTKTTRLVIKNGNEKVWNCFPHTHPFDKFPCNTCQQDAAGFYTIRRRKKKKSPSLVLFTQTGTQVAQLRGCELEVLHTATDPPLNSVSAGQVSALRFWRVWQPCWKCSSVIGDALQWHTEASPT